MKRVSGNVSIEKVPTRSSAVTITPATTSNSSHDNIDDDDDNYYDEDEEQEFEPSPPIVRKPNPSQVQFTPRNVTRSVVNISPVQGSGSVGNRVLPQVSASFDTNTKKIPDRPFKIFSKEAKGLDDDDDIIIESTKIKSPSNFAKPSPPPKNLATPPIRAPNFKMNRPILPPSQQMPRMRNPSMRGITPRSPMRSPLPSPRQRMPIQPRANPNVNFRQMNRGRPRGPFVPPQRLPNSPAGRMQMNPRTQNFVRPSGPRAPNMSNVTRGPSPRLPLQRPTRPQNLNQTAQFPRKLSNQVQIMPRPTAPKLPAPSQVSPNVKMEPKEYEEDEENYEDFEDEIPSTSLPKTKLPAPKLSQVNITPVSVPQPARSTVQVPKLSSSVQITPKVSSQVQITPKATPHIAQAKLPTASHIKDVENDEVNIKEEPMEQGDADDKYEDQEEKEEEYDYYDDEYQDNEEEGDEYQEKEEEYDYYDDEYQDNEEEGDEYHAPPTQPGTAKASSSLPNHPASSAVQMKPVNKQVSKDPGGHVLPATPVSFANIKQGPIIKEEPKEEEEDADTHVEDDYYEDENAENYSESETVEAEPISQPNPPRVSSSIQITPKLGSQVQLSTRQNQQHTPQTNLAVQSNSFPRVSSSVQLTTAKSPGNDSEEQFDESFEEEEAVEEEEEALEEEEEYYDEEMEYEDNQEAHHPLEDNVVQSTPSVQQKPPVPNKFQNVSITPNPTQATSVTPKKLVGVSITPNKPQNVPMVPNKSQNVTKVPNQSAPMILNKPQNAPVGLNKPQNVSMTLNKPQNISMGSNNPRAVSISPTYPQNVTIPPNIPKGISITPNVPKGISITANKPSTASTNVPQNVSFTPKTSIARTENTEPEGEEEYYDEEMGEEEEEESFEDYEEDNMDSESPELTGVRTSSRIQVENIPNKRLDGAQENREAISSSGTQSQKSQLNVETKQPVIRNNPPASTQAKSPSHTSTPTKASTYDSNKQMGQGKTSTNNYQSSTIPNSAPHGRPRSLIEAISMISSGKLSVSNVMAPANKKTTPKKEENQAEKIEDSKPASPLKELESIQVNVKNKSEIEKTNEIDENETKLNSCPVNTEPQAPAVDESLKNNKNDSNDTEKQNTAVSNVLVNNNEDDDDIPVVPKMKMRPKSKLLQFRKQVKAPIVPESTEETKGEKVSDSIIPENTTSATNDEAPSTTAEQKEAEQEQAQDITDKQSEPDAADSVQDGLPISNDQMDVTSETKDDDPSSQEKSEEHMMNENVDLRSEEILNQPDIDNNTEQVDDTQINEEETKPTAESSYESLDNVVDDVNQEENVEPDNEVNANIPEVGENITEGDESLPNENDKDEETAEATDDVEMKEEFDEDLAEKIMREQGDSGEGVEEEQNELDDQTYEEKDDQVEEEEEVDEDEEDNEEEEGGDGEEEEENEMSGEEAKVDKGENENVSMEVDEGEAKEKKTSCKKKTKKKRNKKTKSKKKTAKRKSTDTLEETPSAKKIKTEDGETKESEDKEDPDKAATNKAINMRKNIRDVIDENQLDPATLAAQREEAERLKRVQEQQQRLKEVQRQIAQNNKAAKMLKEMEGENSGSSKPSPVMINLSSGSLNKQMLELLKSQKQEEEEDSAEADVSKLDKLEVSSLAKPLNITSSVSLVPVKKPTEADQKKGKDTAVTLSDSDEDCILISEPSDNETEEEEEDPNNSGMHTNDTFNVPDEQGRVLVNLAHDPSEPDIFLAPQISRIIKPHQVGGIRFLFDNIIESTERYKTSPGFGCILAHSMGLGKTLQIVSFSDIFLRHTEGRTVVCIMPINTLQNWVNEFNMWLPLATDVERSPLLAQGEVRPREFPIFILNDFQKTLPARAKVVKEWHTQGGVLMIGYELYRQLSLKKPKKARRGRGKEPPPPEEEPDDRKQALLEEIYEALVNPGPDLVICDEGHRIKNSHASTSHALKQIRSRRRVVLTGYPLQNNLLEYWCMVDFVRPNYLGTKTEFSNMFERPIQNGQCVDSTPQDVRLMRYRAHVLHSLLQGFVQRRSHMVLQKTLPVKEEYVLLIRMTPLQRELYETFMNEVVRTKAVPNPLKAFAVCCKIWNHPDVLYNYLKKRLGIEDVVADLDIEENASLPIPGDPVIPGKRGRGGRGAAGGRQSGPGSKNARKGGVAQKGSEDPVKSPAVATVMPNTVNHGPGYNYNYPDNYNMTPNSEGGTFPSPAYYNNAEGGTYWNQTPPYSNTSGYHTDTSSNFTDSSIGSMPPSYNQNMNSFNNYNEFSSTNLMQGGSASYNTNRYHAVGNDGTFGSGAGDVSSSFNNPGFTSSNTNFNSGLYNASPYESSSSTFNSTPFSQNNNTFSDNSSLFNSNPLSTEPSASDLDSTGGLVDMMLNEFPTPNPFDEPSTSSKEAAGDKKEDSTSESQPANATEPEKSSEISDKETPESTLDPEKTNSQPGPDSTTPSKTSGREEPGIPYDWAEKLMKDYVPGRVEESSKMVVFMCILEQSLAAGDRILVFSQSLFTLTLIEQFLQKRFVPGRQERWAKNRNYFRLDGSTISTDREKLINEFNANPNVAMFLVSTRAGSLGINLVGANRVIVFDASWNPCHDTQAVCRVYRYGQQKPCFVYRLVMDCCLEKKIYDRQINKQGMADRVVDECNPDAHLSIKEVTNLCWDNEPVPEEKDFSQLKEKYRDSIIQLILDLHSFKLSKEPFQHESLLVDRKDKKLSTAEKRLAKRSYELEKQANTKPVYGGFKNNLGKPMASVRPMQTLAGNNMLREGIGAPRNRQWIPAEVWQKQGMSAQEMTLPLDVVIPTNSNERSIVLKSGQKVMVLKSPKGIYMQLENGKIIAIRTANNKGGMPTPGSKDMLGGLGAIGSNRPAMRSMNTTPRVIDSRFAKDVSIRQHGPRPRPLPMISRAGTMRGGPTPRYKNVTITPSRPGFKKATHSVSCGTAISPPPSKTPAIPAPTVPVIPTASPSTPEAPPDPVEATPEPSPEPKADPPPTLAEAEQSPRASQSPPPPDPSTPPASEQLPLQDDLALMNFEPPPSSSLDYGYEYPQYSGGTSTFYSGSSYQAASDPPSYSSQNPVSASNSPSSYVSQPPVTTPSASYVPQPSVAVPSSSYISQPSVSTPSSSYVSQPSLSAPSSSYVPQPPVSLPSSSSYSPQISLPPSSGGYATQPPLSAPISGYGGNTGAVETSPYSYDMYSGGSNINPFTAAAVSNAFGYQSSAFHRPESSYPPTPYPSQYSSDFYPPPP